MTTTEKALDLCDKLGITDPIQRERFMWGYSHGHTDAQIEDLKQRINLLTEIAEKVTGKSVFPDVETR